MSLKIKKIFRNFENRLLLIYIVIGGLWIVFSDRILAGFASDVASLTRLQTYKGWLYVILSGLLIYFITRMYRKHISQQMRELDEARAKAESSDRLKSIFLQNISHEIRTPLNSILGFSDLLSQTEQLSAQQIDHLKHISTSGEELLAFFDKLLDVSLIETGEVKVYKRLNHFQEIIHELMIEAKHYQQTYPNLQFQLIDDLPIDKKQWHGDVQLLKKVVTNLLENAFKFTSEGCISLYLGFDEPYYLIEVRDTGPGIFVQDKNVIFDDFRIAVMETGHIKKGAGMGLYIAFHFAQLLGGSLHLISEPHKGSVFQLRFP